VGAAVAQRQAVRRIKARPDPHADERFGSLRGRPVRVTADDGVKLHAEIDGEDRTDLAIVFSHGWTLGLDSWHYQRKALRGLGRLVFWDQRGHGRSGPSHRGGCTVPQLGADLAAIIRETVPEGTPVILAGHSMGGITIMSYADLHPDEFGRSVLGTALLCTSSGHLDEVTLGLPTLLAVGARRMLPTSIRAVRLGTPLIERIRPLLHDGSLLLDDHLAFGPQASPSNVTFLEKMASETRMDALLDFLGALHRPGTFATLVALAEADTVVIGAENDMLTPLGHSLSIAAAVPGARLEVVPQAGHMAMMERPDTVNAHLKDLIERCTKNGR
jgi:pimeloyl-ACP methyl ester carboxylesterase